MAIYDYSNRNYRVNMKTNSSILIELIKQNKIDKLHSILQANEDSFQVETNDNPMNYFINQVLDIKKQDCYTNTAIKYKRYEILQLLLDYGFKFQIFKINKTKCTDSIYATTWIDASDPFITEDEKILEILLQKLPDINEKYSVNWDNGKGEEEYVELSLLSIALHFNKMDVVKLLIRKGARLEYNLYAEMTEHTKGYPFMSPIYSNPILNGYYYRMIDQHHFDILLNRKHEQSPIGIIFRKGDWDQIDWLVQNYENHPGIAKEIVKSIYYMKKKDALKFIKKYPQFLNKIEIKDITRNSNIYLLKYVLDKAKPSIHEKDVLTLLDFHYQTNRPQDEVFNHLLSEDYVKCVEAIYSYAPELFLNTEVQNQFYNMALCILALLDEIEKLSKDNSVTSVDYLREQIDRIRKQRNYLNLFTISDRIVSHIPDATMFIKWYYGRERREGFYRILAMDGVNAIHYCRLPSLNDKPRLNLDSLFEEETKISSKEIVAMIDTFDLYSEQSDLCSLYKIILKKDSIPLLKKLLLSSHLKKVDLQQISEYAIEIGAEKIIPFLLLYNSKMNTEMMK